MDAESRQFIRRLGFPIGFVLFLWVIHVVKLFLGMDLVHLGVFPRSIDGLPGILTGPMIHGSWEHLFSNSISFLILGAIMVLIGYYANVGAILLLTYWLPFTLIVYSFWNDPQPLQRLNALYFMRNLAVCGGLLLLIANGAGKYSVKRLIHVMRLPK